MSRLEYDLDCRTHLCRSEWSPQQRWADFKARMDAAHRVPPRAAGRDAP
jgi:hypothetical protein